MSKKTLLVLACIAALAPQGEEFTPEAVNEGVWLTEAHLEAIEGALAAYKADETTAASNLTAANNAKKVAEDALKVANTTITARDNRISELEAENVKLGGKPAPVKTPAPAVDRAPIDDNTGKSKYHTAYDDMAAEYIGAKK